MILRNFDLKYYNTFHLSALAKFFSVFSDEEDLMELISEREFQKEKPFILGGGSNILLLSDLNNFVLKNEILGKEIVRETNEHFFVRVGAGENWHEFVEWCISRNMAGIENLSLIPGKVGASPMQNIGAYGVEVKDIFHELEAIEIETGNLRVFSREDCKFGYRESVFKNEEKGKYIITRVCFRLNKKAIFSLSYGAIEKELEAMNVQQVSIAAVSEAVIRIRKSKLPDPAILGNAGSFFKNPEITPSLFLQLKAQFQNIVSYPLENGNHKLAAGWLIENCGLKGFRKGDAGIHHLQALVLVNYGNASGKEIFDLSEMVIQQVKLKFNVLLEREVNIISS